MTKRRVIAWHCFPQRMPLWSTITLWLFMDRLEVHGAMAGAVWAVWGLVCIASLSLAFSEEKVDILKDRAR